MYKISWEQIRFSNSNGLLSPGDIIFLSDCKTIMRHRIIHSAQRISTMFLSTKCEKHKKEMHHKIYHVAIVVANPEKGNILTIAESTRPFSQIVPVEMFYQIHSARSDIMIFRSTIPILSHWMGLWAFSYGNQNLPYFSVKESIFSCIPTKNFSSTTEMSARFNCGSFVSFIYDTAIASISTTYPHLKLHTKPMNYREVAPIHIYHDIQKRIETEGSWRGVYHAESIQGS